MSQMTSKILYYADSAPITQRNVENALADAGIKKGDTIMVHSDVKSFGRLGTLNKDSFLQALTDSMKNAVGSEGTIIMPTFTYSFFKNEPYDINNSKSTVGVLTEYFRKQPDVGRTSHPTHSVAVWGRHKKDLLDIGKGTFDKYSIFGKFHKLNGKFVSFGVPLGKSCTFVHYIECMHGVPYRYLRKFRGKIISDGNEYEHEISFCYKYAFIFNSMLKFEEHLRKEGLLKEAKVGNGAISVIEAGDLFDEGSRLLDKDIYFFLRNDTLFFKVFHNTVCFFLKYVKWPFRILDKVALKFFS